MSLKLGHRPNHNGSLVRRQAFQFELLPNGEQQRQMSRSPGCAPYVYHKALALKQERYQKKEKLTATHYNKPSWTSTVPMPTFSRSEPSSRSFTRRACGIHSGSPTRSASN